MRWDSLQTLLRAEQLSDPLEDPEPRWPAFVAILAVGGLFTALPEELTMGPRGLLPSLVVALLIPSIVSHHTGRHRLSTALGFAVDGVLTLGLIISVVLLIGALPSRQNAPQALLFSAASLWITNILVFALWYWRLDAGGPHQRDKRAKHAEGSFLFPQMTMREQTLKDTGQQDWSPEFIDYLFLAFNTSTAFSPTDVPVLTKWAKVLMMLQSLLSLLIIALLAARAVNLL
jgi:Predicted membrane protein